MKKKEDVLTIPERVVEFRGDSTFVRALGPGGVPVENEDKDRPFGWDEQGSSLPTVPSALQPDPYTAAIDARWEEFKSADYEGKIALFYRTLDEGSMDKEMAFEMLAEIQLQAAERRTRPGRHVSGLLCRTPTPGHRSPGTRKSWPVGNASSIWRPWLPQITGVEYDTSRPPSKPSD